MNFSPLPLSPSHIQSSRFIRPQRIDRNALADVENPIVRNLVHIHMHNPHFKELFSRHPNNPILAAAD